MLEAHVGYKLFNRKSKGVEPTEYAKLLNNLIIEALTDWKTWRMVLELRR
jgi:DNA-binding transcriptional LysR family regulator